MTVINIVSSKQVTAAERWDAEFFDPEDLHLIKRLEREGGQQLKAVCSVLNGKTPPGYVEEGGVPVVRSGDLVHPFIYPGVAEDFLLAPRGKNLVRVKTGDVLISSIGMGSIGKISLVLDAGSFVTVSEVTILRTKGYPAEILFAYLRTKSGQRQIARQITGATGQQHLLKSKVEMILVPPAPSKQVCDSIIRTCQSAWKLQVETAKEHRKIHQTLAGALSLSD
jgi:type I restriction enzyme, S subunit